MPPLNDDAIDWFLPLTIKGNFSDATLDSYFDMIGKRLKDDMAFLRKPIVQQRNWSLYLRILAFVSLALAVLLPLPIIEPLDRGPNGLEFGYLSALLGGLVLFADQVFGISSAWMRLTLAEMEVKQVRYRLELDWARRRPLLKTENAATEGPALIDILKTAMDASHDIMQSQKVTWTSEIRQGMDALRSRLNEDRVALERLRAEQLREQARPKTGAVNITIDKPGDLKGPLIVKIGDEERLKLDGAAVPAKVSVNNVPAGLQTIALSATRTAAPYAPFLHIVTEAIPAGDTKCLTVAVA